jgi:nitrite reductase (NADH) large subunit
MKYLLIGSGPAGIFAAEAIREQDRESPITMVSADDGPAYSPVMTTYWLAGHLPRERLFFRDPSWAERVRIDFHPGQRVTSIHTAARRVMVSEDREIPYDRLLIATGSTPISLSIPGIGSKGVTSLRGLHDAEKILEPHGESPRHIPQPRVGRNPEQGPTAESRGPRRRVEGSSGVETVAIIGGGFIGLKLACHLKERGLSVTVVEKEPKLAARMFDLKASQIVGEKLREKGITVETDVEVVEIIEEKGWVSGVLLKDGRTFPCQRIIEAVGVRPNTRFLAGSGVDLRGGIPVNGRMETNVPGVYAAGDVAMTIDPVTSDWVNNATWPAATRQGRVAGSNMAGGDRTYVHNFTLNALNLFGFQVMAAGHAYYEKGPDANFLLEDRNESYRKIVIKDGHPIGFILIGDISGAGYLLSLMKRKETSPFDLRGRSFSVHLPPNLGYDHGSIFQRKGDRS